MRFDRYPGLEPEALGPHAILVQRREVTLNTAAARGALKSIPLSRRHNPCLKDRRIKRLVKKHGLNCEPDFIVEASLTPNDALYSSLWGMQGAFGIGAPTAWNVSNGSGVTVAVLDTGVDRNHPDLAANMWINTGEIASNGIDDDANGYIDDVNGWDFYDNDNDPSDMHGHGTHVSGTIAGTGNNSIGVIGAAYGAKIMALRFIGPGGGLTSHAIFALYYAIDKGIPISNNSWGGAGFSSALQAAISDASTSGMLFVAAAGNNGTNNDSVPFYPASYTLPNIVSVGSITSTGTISNFSNYGATSVDLFAPGSGILSSLPSNSYASWDGTSMASPHVAGVAAQILSVNSGFSTAQIKDALLNNSSSDATYLGACLTSGRLNAATAVQIANTPTPTPTQSPTTPQPGATITPAPTSTPVPSSPTLTPTPLPPPSPEDEDEPDAPDEQEYGIFVSSGETENVLVPGTPAELIVLSQTSRERVSLLLERTLPGQAQGTKVRCARTGRFRTNTEDSAAFLRTRVSPLARYLPGLSISLLNASNQAVASVDLPVEGNIADLVSSRRARILGQRACQSIAGNLRLLGAARSRYKKVA